MCKCPITTPPAPSNTAQNTIGQNRVAPESERTADDTQSNDLIVSLRHDEESSIESRSTNESDEIPPSQASMRPLLPQGTVIQEYDSVTIEVHAGATEGEPFSQETSVEQAQPQVEVNLEQ